MRSSKSRSRSKQNRPRTLGNIINRVFDSSGPEGKVRGTPQQIIEKYQHLARDAQLSNDRVAHENFMQHAEHYTRMLGEAMREMAEQDQRRPEGQQQPRRDDRDDGNGWQQANGGNGNTWQGNGNGNGNRAPQQGNAGQNTQGGRDDQRGERRADYRPEYRAETRGDYRTEQPRDFVPEPADVIGFDAEGDAGLVETPEARTPRPQQQERAPQQDRPQSQDRTPQQGRPPRDRAPRPASEPAPVPPAAEAPAAEDVQASDTPAAARGPRRPRGPRKPRAEGAEPEAPTDTTSGPREAAE